MATVFLKAENKQMNCNREYYIHTSIDLFGMYQCQTKWGKVGAIKRSKTVSFENEEELRRYVKLILRRRETAKRRIGVAYRVIENCSPHYA